MYPRTSNDDLNACINAFTSTTSLLENNGKNSIFIALQDIVL